MLEKGEVKIDNVSKRYFIGNQKSEDLRISLSKLLRKNSSKKLAFWALKNVSVRVNPGEVVGIIGKNGAGKSTLLKLLSNITKPTTGRIEFCGRVASLLEVGTGFHPELTGRENIFLNGTILGMTKKEVNQKFDEIVEFSGVKKFLDTPVKHYSSGMYVRLAFSVAAHLEPEILLIDEVLAVGDQTFQKKCLGKMKDVSSAGRTVFFVSHNMAAVKNLCTKGILLDKGEIKKIGSIEEVVSEYAKSDSGSSKYIPEKIKENIPVAFTKIGVYNIHHESCSDFTVEDKVRIQFNFEIRNEDHNYSVFVIVRDKYDAPVFSAEHKITGPQLELLIDNHFLTRGRYSLHSFIHIPKVKQIDVAVDVCNFVVTDATSPLAIHGAYEYGSVFGNYKWIEKA